jgi:Mrp family chromosome partitioning ATPase
VFQELYNHEKKNFSFQKINSLSNLVFIPCGQISTHPSQVFDHQLFAEFLIEAKKRFDFIIFDSSPVGKYYDSIVLASHMDCMILITEAEKTNDFEISRAKKILEERNIPIFGVILNRRKFRIPASIFNRFFK